MRSLLLNNSQFDCHILQALERCCKYFNKCNASTQPPGTGAQFYFAQKKFFQHTGANTHSPIHCCRRRSREVVVVVNALFFLIQATCSEMINRPERSEFRIRIMSHNFDSRRWHSRSRSSTSEFSRNKQLIEQFILFIYEMLFGLASQVSSGRVCAGKMNGKSKCGRAHTKLWNRSNCGCCLVLLGYSMRWLDATQNVHTAYIRLLVVSGPLLLCRTVAIIMILLFSLFSFVLISNEEYGKYGGRNNSRRAMCILARFSVLWCTGLCWLRNQL